ncbi:MAG TPA: PHP domain-containing protein [Gemmatimonadaceae bacterium]|nr:PHP domain-containing protein [Gemmatimonadaceae bacterium]
MTSPAARGAASSTAGGAPRFVDLHSHSTASDGALAPEDVIARARSAGLTAVALTDHDTLAGIPAAREAGKRLGVRVVAGVELSAVDGDRELHLLGLHIARVDALEQELAAFREARHARAVRIVERLNKLAVPVTLDAILRESAGGAIGRPHIARAMVAGGWVRDQREAFDRFLGYGRPAFVAKRKLTVGDAVRLVHDSGGICVFAHPGQEGTRSKLEALRGLGLDGVEVRHPSHSTEDVARLLALADHLGLVPSGGSDWHGAAEGPRTLGAMQVPHEWLDRQDARVAERQKLAQTTA